MGHKKLKQQQKERQVNANALLNQISNRGSGIWKNWLFWENDKGKLEVRSDDGQVIKVGYGKGQLLYRVPKQVSPEYLLYILVEYILKGYLIRHDYFDPLVFQEKEYYSLEGYDGDDMRAIKQEALSLGVIHP